MRPENRALLVISTAVVVVVAVCGAFIMWVGAPGVLPIPGGLLVPSGTVIRQSGFNVTFTISGGSGRIVGAWSADWGGMVTMCPVRSECRLNFPRCPPANITWDMSVDASFVSGPWIMAFYPSGGGAFVITQTLRVVSPGVSPSADGTFWQSGNGTRC